MNEADRRWMGALMLVVITAGAPALAIVRNVGIGRRHVPATIVFWMLGTVAAAALIRLGVRVASALSSDKTTRP